MKELQIEITEENYQRAIKADSGSCLVADAIKAAYPHLQNVKVDVATVRVTDPKAGERYIFLTPPSVSTMLLYYDQGWEEKSLPKKLRIRDLARITPITRSASDIKLKAEKRAARLAELEVKEQSGEQLTGEEKRSLARLRRPRESITRPTSPGKPIVEGREPHIVIRGGRELVVADSERNPNLLGGRKRHFAAKTAQPSQAFQEAVSEAAHKMVKQAARLAVLADRKKRRQEQS